jgi:hypothetical protein
MGKGGTMESRRVFSIVVALAALILSAWSPTVWSNPEELKASNPKPEDGATGVVMPLFQWTKGATAVYHDVYLGTQPELGQAERVATHMVPPLFFYTTALKPGSVYYWRVDTFDAKGTIHTGDTWHFTTQAVTASDPSPADGATDVDPTVKLTWSPGAYAMTHSVYFGTDKALVTQGAAEVFKGTQVAPVYDPGVLQLGTKYFWRIEEVSGRSSTMNPGPVWNFTTRAELAASTYYVSKEGSDERDGLSPEKAFATIQRGIDAAVDGDTVLVYPGVYRRPINFRGKAITVRSAGHAAVLAVETDFAASFYSGEGRDSVLENFVIRDSFLGLFVVQSSPTLRNLTIVRNKYGLEAYADAEPAVVNCIFWYNTAADLVGCKARFSCVQRGSEGLGNFSRDPLFVDPNERDYHLRSERGRYWPAFDVWVLDKVTSPCIDAGDPKSDYSGEPKPNGERINLGAYGGTAYASMSEVGQVPNEPPVVKIIAPEDGKTYDSSPQTIHIVAEASDADGFVVKVEFFEGDNKIGEDTDGSDGWAMDWKNYPLEHTSRPHGRNPTSGYAELVARATDDRGAPADSPAITVRYSGSSVPVRR